MNSFLTDEIEKIISASEGGPVPPELAGVIYSLGRDADNPEEYEYAFRQLVRLSAHPSSYVLSMTVLAFSLLALYHERLDREIAEPVIRRAWSVADRQEKMRIQDAVDDINHVLGWELVLEKLPGDAGCNLAEKGI